MNSLQSLTQWEDSFNHPNGSLLGLLNAIQYIGSIVSLPIAPVRALLSLHPVLRTHCTRLVHHGHSWPSSWDFFRRYCNVCWYGCANLYA